MVRYRTAQTLEQRPNPRGVSKAIRLAEAAGWAVDIHKTSCNYSGSAAKTHYGFAMKQEDPTVSGHHRYELLINNNSGKTAFVQLASRPDGHWELIHGYVNPGGVMGDHEGVYSMAQFNKKLTELIGLS
jgi:hypothetical protein